MVMSADPLIDCPKCGHEPLPIDQTLPAACPACGVILAKVSALDIVDPIITDDERNVSFQQRFAAAMLFVPSRVDPIAFWSRCITLALFAIWGVQLVRLNYQSGEMMSSFLHGPLLVFHEAGHVIFSPLGEFIMVLGGSLAQLLMPAIIAVALLIRNRDPFGAALGTWFFGVSLLDLAPYVYDSLHPELMLLGGHTGAEGGHDWIYLLSKLGLLEHSQGLGSMVHKIGSLMMLLSVCWAGWVLVKQKALMANSAADPAD
jgi:hypothetical protein